MKLKILLILLFGILINNVNGQIDKFYISMWSNEHKEYTICTPEGTDPLVPNDFMFLKQLKDLNFNLVHIYAQLTGYSGMGTKIDGVIYPIRYSRVWASDIPSLEFMDNAQKLGMKVLLSCPEMFPRDFSYNSSLVSEALNYYGNHPALLGFNIYDEPDLSSTLDEIKKYSDDILAYNTELVPYVNLLPMCSFGYNPTMYRNFIQEYIDKCSPQMLSFDWYPIATGMAFYARDNFYTFHIISEKSVENNLPFMHILTPVMTYKPYVGCAINRAKNLSEFNFVIYSALSYGAKSLCYWHSGVKSYNPWDEAVSDDVKDGLAKIHEKILKNENVILSLDFINAFHYSDVSTVADTVTLLLPPNTGWSDFLADPLTLRIFNNTTPIATRNATTLNPLMVSYFEDDQGNNYFWLFNKDYHNSMELTINLNTTMDVIDILNQEIVKNVTSFEVDLAPGEAKLFKPKQMSSSDIDVCCVIFGNTFDFDNDFFQEGINFVNTCYATNGANASIYADNITLNPGVSINNVDKVSFYPLKTVTSLKSAQTTTKENVVEENNITEEIKAEILVFPNPVTGTFTISGFDEGYNKITIFNTLGKLVYSTNTSLQQVDIDISDQPNGIYLIKILSGGKDTDKIIIKQ